MAEQFGKIDFKLACRFDELSRNEIRVLVYLYACRNEETGQCNPRRKTICKNIKLDKGNLSKAISGLQDKGFLIEFSDGSFELISAENIVNPNLEVVETPTEKVVKSTTEVVKTPTKSCRNTNSHINEFEQKKNRERTETTKNIADKSARLVEKNPVEVEVKKSVTEKLPTKSRPPEYKRFREALFNLHRTRLNGAIPDAAAQNMAICWLFDNSFSVGDCLMLYAEQVKELKPNGWRAAVSWQTVKKQIPDWVSQGKPILERKNEKSIRINTNGHQKSDGKSNAEILRNRDFSDFDGFDPVKAFG